MRALALVGSYARGSARPDSDVDVVLLTEDVERYTDSDSWAEELGGRVIQTKHWGALIERRVAMRSGPELEIGVAAPSWAATDPLDAGTAAVVRDGLRILHDPDGLLAALTAAVPWGGPGSR